MTVPTLVSLKGNIAKNVSTNSSKVELSNLDSYEGAEANFWGSLAKFLNFRINISFSEYGYRSVLPNGSKVGNLEDLVKEKNFIVGNRIAIYDYKIQHAVFTRMIEEERLCLVAGQNMLPIFKIIFKEDSRLGFLILEGFVFITISLTWLCILKWSHGFNFFENLGYVLLTKKYPKMLTS